MDGSGDMKTDVKLCLGEEFCDALKDRPQIVRCKDCKHWYPLTKTCNNVDGACCQSYVADDWFCADGVKKDD
jgi:hypothetical protein